LAIVKMLVESHHGEIWVESELGQGSTFYVKLPRRAAVDVSPAADKPEPPPDLV